MSKRPDGKNWAAKEVIGHLRDTAESFMARFDVIMAMDDPKLVGVNPDRWAEKRQYLRNDVTEALAAFRRRREETLGFFAASRASSGSAGAITPRAGA